MTMQKHTIATASSSMTFVPAKGGSACSLQFLINNHWQELLYCHDNYWDDDYDDLIGGWPFIFPICARIARNQEYGAYLYDGAIYHLPIHGFAPYLAWQVNKVQENSIELQLTDSKGTYKQYPFHFKVILKYTLFENELICEQQYFNCDNKVMPYYAGFHPYFSVADKGNTFLTFNAEKRFRYNKDFTDLIGTQALPKIPVCLADPAINESLYLLTTDKSVQLKFGDQFKLQLQTDFDYLQLYHMPEKPFFCVEPWMAFPNAMNSVYGAKLLAPHSSEAAVSRLKVW